MGLPQTKTLQQAKTKALLLGAPRASPASLGLTLWQFWDAGRQRCLGLRWHRHCELHASYLTAPARWLAQPLLAEFRVASGFLSLSEVVYSDLAEADCPRSKERRIHYFISATFSMSPQNVLSVPFCIRIKMKHCLLSDETEKLRGKERQSCGDRHLQPCTTLGRFPCRWTPGFERIPSAC